MSSDSYKENVLRTEELRTSCEGIGKCFINQFLFLFQLLKRGIGKTEMARKSIPDREKHQETMAYV